MALQKSVRGEDGVVANYHRILYLMITPNKQNSIAVKSYTDNEIRVAELSGGINEPYSRNTTYETAYDPEMSISKAYTYLKTLPEFNGALDI